MGDFYERLVGLVKRSLRKSVGRNLLSDNQLETLLNETEAVVSSRPLEYIGDDIDSSITLTPGHFLTLNPKAGVPELEFGQADPDFDPNESSADRLIRILKKRSKVSKRVLEIMAGGLSAELKRTNRKYLKNR